MLGVEYQGLPTATAVKTDLDVNFARGIGPDYWEKRKNVFELRLAESWLNAGKLREYVGTEPVTFKGPAVRVKPATGTQTLATLRVKDDPKAEPFPAVVSRTHGKGRVVYLPAGLDAGYYLYAYPYQRCLLANAIRWAANEFKQPITVTAPMCVQSTVMRQDKDGKQRLIVHLFNDLNTTGGKALPVDDVPLREETLPIHDIRVTFRKGTKLGAIRLQPDGVELKATETADGITVVLPKLTVHAMVVAELLE